MTVKARIALLFFALFLSAAKAAAETVSFGGQISIAPFDFPFDSDLAATDLTRISHHSPYRAVLVSLPLDQNASPRRFP